MRGLFGVVKHREKKLTAIEEAADRINKRGDIVEEKIKKLELELLSFKESIKNTRPGPAQDALKARALLVLKHKRIYEAQKDMLDSQRLKLEQVSSPTTDSIKSSQQTVLQRLSWVICR